MTPTVMSDGEPMRGDFRTIAKDERRWTLRRMSFQGLINLAEGFLGMFVPDGVDKENLIEGIIEKEYPE
jgi:hypothetical protein